MIAKPTTRLRSSATSTRLRASVEAASDARHASATASASSGSASAGTSPAYVVRQARTCRAAIAAASSAQAMRTDTSAVGAAHGAILSARRRWSVHHGMPTDPRFPR